MDIFIKSSENKETICFTYKNILKWCFVISSVLNDKVNRRRNSGHGYNDSC